MLFERVVTKQKESAAIPDGKLIRVIERETIDNGKRGEDHRIVQKTTISSVDRETGKLIGEPEVTTKRLKKMPGFGEAIWEIRDADTERHIRDNVREIMRETAQEKAQREADEADEAKGSFEAALKARREAVRAEKPKVEPKPVVKKAEPVLKPEPTKKTAMPDIWWL